MKRCAPILMTLMTLTAMLLPVSADAKKPTDKAIQKVIKTVINAIRYDKDDLAASRIAFGPMAAAIMDDAWKDMGAADRKELTAGIETLIRKLSFVKGRDMFEYLDAMLYSPIKTDGKRVTCKTTVVVHRKYKKTEIVIEFILIEDGGAWKIMDTVMAGESTAEGIHEDQIEDLLDEGGIPAVMKALRDKLAEIANNE